MKKTILITFILSAIIVKSHAQLAVLNSQKVMASIPAFAKTDTLIVKETARYTAEYNSKQQALNQLVKVADSLYKIDAKAAATTKAIADAQAFEKDLKAYADASNKKIAEFRNLVQKPYIDKIMAAIKVVAIRRKFMQVLDASNSMLYVNPLSDITEDVIKELKLN